MKRLLTGIMVLVCTLAAHSQTTQITASNIAKFGGSKVTGQFCVSPVNASGQPISIVTPSGQQFAPSQALCFPIVNGVLNSAAIVPDTSLTQPVNVCYLLTITDNFNRQLATYPCIQPSGATWSFDAYVPTTLPSIPALTLPQFYVNGVLNAAQGIVNFVGSGVTYGAGGVVNIAAGLPSIANNTLLGNNSGATAAAAALTASQVSTLLGLGTAATQSTSAFDAAGAASTAQAASLQKSSNLSDLASASTARTNLGLGTAATQASSAFDASGAASTAQAASLQKTSNLSDLASASTARTNLGLGAAATQALSAFLQPSNNLSDVSSASTARTNLGLGSASTLASSAVAQTANNLSDLASASTARTNLGLGTAATAVAPANTTRTSHNFLTAYTSSSGAFSQAGIGADDASVGAYVAGAGSVNVLTATLSPAPASLFAGLEVDVLPNLANTTTTPTLNLNSLGAKTITRWGQAALEVGDLTTTAVGKFIYDGTDWELQNPQTLSAQYGTAAGCLAATTVTAPCIAYQANATGLSATYSGTAHALYTSSAPANGVFEFCPTEFQDTGTGTITGSAQMQVTWTTAGGTAETGAGLQNITFGSGGGVGNGSCVTISTQANSTLSVNMTTTGGGGTVTWEYDLVVRRLK